MAQFYLITKVNFPGGVLAPGTLLDSVVDPLSYNYAVNGGGELVPAADTTVAAAAAVAAAKRAQGASFAALESIMRTAVDQSQGDQSGAHADSSDLASNSNGLGAALVGIEDAAAIFTATTVEGALAEVKAEADSAINLQKRTVTLTHGAITAAPDTSGTAFVANIGAILPANAVVLACEANVSALFAGGTLSAMKLDIGGTDADMIVSQMDVFTGAATGALSPRTGDHAQGKFSGEQLVATLTPTGDKTSAATAGSVAITVWFAVLA